MKEIEQYKAFIESICNVYGIVDAIKPLQQGLDAMMEATLGMENIGAYDVDDKFLNQMSTDEYESSNADPQAAKQLWDVFDETFASANGVDAAYQKALDDIAAQGVDTSTLPQDNSAYIAAFGTSIESDESEQPWMCETCALTESNSFRDQAKYDLNAYNSDADNVDDIKSMGRSLGKYGFRKTGVKGMGLSGKFGDAYNLKDDGMSALTSRNSGIAPVGRSQMKAQEKEFYMNDVNDQLGDMMATDPTDGIVNDLKTALGDLYAKWNAQNDAAGVMASDADFRQYVEDALNDMTFQG